MCTFSPAAFTPLVLHGVILFHLFSKGVTYQCIYVLRFQWLMISEFLRELLNASLIPQKALVQLNP